MAVYQYKALLVPQAHLAGLGSEALSDMDFYDISDEGWRRYQPPADYVQYLGGILPRGESWTASLLVWGDLRSNCVTVELNQGSVETIAIRIDVRSLDQTFIAQLVEFGRHCSCVFLQPNRKVVAPQTDALQSAIAKSRAYKFCNEPGAYFEELSAPSAIVGHDEPSQGRVEGMGQQEWTEGGQSSDH
jgi:hypothetical protein